MNILMINYEFPPIGGGGGNANLYILREFAKERELDIDLVTSSESSRDYVERFSENITIHRLNVNKKELQYWTQAEVLRFLHRSSGYVKRLLKGKKYHISHAFFGFPSGFITYRHREEIPYIVSLRGSDVPGFNVRFSFQYMFLTPLFKRIWRRAGAVIANSEELRSLALKTTPEIPIEVIYNGIDIEEFRPAAPSPLAGEGRGEGRAFTILCVARLIPRKGIDYLIRALPVISKAHPDVRLVIVGEGNMEQELKKLASELDVKERVDFRGYVRHDELPGIYREADIFVLPSLWEGMSNTLLEAIASGLPVVVTETGGTAELVKDIGTGTGKGRGIGRGNGIIIPKEDSRAISEAVLRVLDSKELRMGMGARSRETAMEFSWGSVARQYMSYYERCATNGGDRPR